MTAPRPRPMPHAVHAPAPGCTCIHAAALHSTSFRPLLTRPGCIVGWSGKGEPIPGMPGKVHYPAGCTCTATGPEASGAPSPAEGVV